MKIKTTLVLLCSSIFLSGCISSKSNFPSVLGTAQQESVLHRGNRIIKSVFMPKVETFGTEKLISLTEDMNGLVNSVNANEQKYQTAHNIIAVNKDEYYENVQEIEQRLKTEATPKDPELYLLLEEVKQLVEVVSTNQNRLNTLSAEMKVDVQELGVFIKSIKSASSNSSATQADRQNMLKLLTTAEELLLKASKLQKEVAGDAEKQKIYVEKAQKQTVVLNEAIMAGGFDKVSKYEKIVPLFIRKNIPSS